MNRGDRSPITLLAMDWEHDKGRALAIYREGGKEHYQECTGQKGSQERYPESVPGVA